MLVVSLVQDGAINVFVSTKIGCSHEAIPLLLLEKALMSKFYTQ